MLQLEDVIGQILIFMKHNFINNKYTMTYDLMSI